MRLQQRRRLDNSAVKGDRVTVKCGGGAWDAKVVESPATAGDWKVEYADGGVVATVDSAWKMCGMFLGGVAMIPIKRYGRGGMNDYGTVQRN